jgi:hypothetical protein
MLDLLLIVAWTYGAVYALLLVCFLVIIAFRWLERLFLTAPASATQPAKTDKPDRAGPH